jgi:Fe-S cluster assembly ATP-binding protein
MLKIKNITAVSESQSLIKNINLDIKAGEIHAVLGPKHSGKSALAHVVAGHPSIQITEGTIHWNRKKLESFEPEERFNQGIFVSFQYPPEFEAVTNWELAKEFFGHKETDISDLQLKYSSCCEILDLGDEHGDKVPSLANMVMHQAKRNELIHMLLSNPKLIVLDEIDDGLNDQDILLIASILKDFLQEHNKSCLLITHNQTLLQILNPTHVHVMVGGEIKLSGSTELYTRIIEDGYSEFS